MITPSQQMTFGVDELLLNASDSKIIPIENQKNANKTQFK